MIIATTQKASQVIGGVEIFSPMGLTILTIGILFTVGVPLTMILRGKKDYVIFTNDFMENKIVSN